jgi:hypothetical protein
MAACTSGDSLGAGAADSGLRSETIFVASSKRGRRWASVQPNPRVNQAFWVWRVNAICAVLDFPASLTYPVRTGTSGLGGRSLS